MRRSFCNRLTASAAIVALFVATSAFLFHGHQSEGQPDNEIRCTLCLHLSGTAGAAPAPGIVATLALVVRLPWRADHSAVPTLRRTRAHQARAPPAFS